MSAPSWAVPGAKCVCIDEHIPLFAGMSFAQKMFSLLFSRAPAKGEICLINKVEHEFGSTWIIIDGYGGWSFEVHHFRPLVGPTIEDDMEHFLPLLNTIGEDA